MRVLITGSSGQIGTNLALRLLKDGHDVFGVDKRPNAWVKDAFPTLLQDDELVRNVLRALGAIPCTDAKLAVLALTATLTNMTLPAQRPPWAPETQDD